MWESLMQMLVFAWQLEGGGLPSNTNLYYSAGSKYSFFEDRSAAYTKLNTRLYVGSFYLGGAASTYVTNPLSEDFRPFRGVYDFTLGYQTSRFAVGYIHSCTHPIETAWTNFTVKSDYISGAYDKIFVQLSGEYRFGRPPAAAPQAPTPPRSRIFW